VEFRVASAVSGGSLSFEEAGGTPSYTTVAITNTGGWQNWVTVSKTITLTAGVHKFGIKANAGGWNINWFRISKL
jgi:endoglucanase